MPNDDTTGGTDAPADGTDGPGGPDDPDGNDPFAALDGALAQEADFLAALDGAIDNQFLQLVKGLTTLHERVDEVEGAVGGLREEFDRERATLGGDGDERVVATVDRVTDGEAVVEVSTNQRFIPTDGELTAGDQIILNESFGVVDTTDDRPGAQSRQMEVTDDPGVGFDDIGGLTEQTRTLRETVELPLTEPERLAELGVSPPRGILLHGPPGTGKTMLAKAVASEVGATFLALSGTEVVRKHIGEGPRLIRDLFTVARKRAPAIVFIDEIDAIAQRRSGAADGEHEIQRILTQLLTELDGFEDDHAVRVVAATNRRDVLDEALLRPGRLGKHVAVPRPDRAGRRHILRIHTGGMRLADGIDLGTLARATEGTSGADLAALCTEAGMIALRRDHDAVSMADFEAAIDRLDDTDADAITPPSAPTYS
jgi:proteasome regulatory subunit